MELVTKQGYKQTEVGLIPEDWEVNLFKEIFKVNQGLQIAIEQRQKHPSSSSKKYITIQYLNDGKAVEYINDYSESVCCTEKDILMTRTGNTGMVITNVNGVFHNNFFKINFDRKKLDKNYIVFYLKQNSTQKRILEKAGTSTIPDLNHNDFYSLQIPIPPTLTEQKAIATALSDVDALIASLEQTIAKKKAIKQGAIQQLLTPPHKGGKRLPGFSGEWVEKKLGEVTEYQNGAAHENCVVKNGDFVIVNSKFVSTEGRVRKYSNQNLCPVNKDEILMVLSDIPNGKAIAKCFYVEENNKYTLNQRICSFKTDKVNSRFLYLILNRNPYYLKFDDGVKQTNLRNEDVLSCPLTLPPSKAEQEVISRIIFDLDKGIDLALSKKAKYQAIKQGMMQELLTGKTRLIN